MQLREMRFAKIEATEVIVSVNSAAEAKAAIKELRHKKKEIGLLKRRMQKELAGARRAVAREDRERTRAASRRGIVGALKRVSRALTAKRPERDLAAIERELETTEEILHNLDSCIIQIEGKLLT